MPGEIELPDPASPEATQDVHCEALRSFSEAGWSDLPAKARWPRWRTTQLRQYVAQKLSAGQIARLMDCTRNAIIGRCWRLRLQLAGSKGLREFDQEYKRKHHRPPPASAKPLWKPRPRQARKKPAGAPGSRPVPIMRLTEKTCRWPLWAQDAPSVLRMYCGADVVDGLSYCPHHARLAFVKPYSRPGAR
jgi:GcrA cell cycle regulator